MSGWTEWAHRWAEIALGAGIGTAAKYGLVISERRAITWRWIVGDLLLLGFVMLVARILADWMKLDRDGATMCGALCALGSYKLVQIIRVRFLRKVDDTLAETFKQAKGELRQSIQMEASGEQVLRRLADGGVESLPIFKGPGGPPA